DPWERYQQPAELVAALTPWVQLAIAPTPQADIASEPRIPLQLPADSDRSSRTPDSTLASTAIMATGSMNRSASTAQPARPDESDTAALLPPRQRRRLAGFTAGGVVMVGLAIGVMALLARRGSAPDTVAHKQAPSLAPAQAALQQLTARAADP